MNSWFISILILNHVLLSSFSSSILHHDSTIIKVLVTAPVLNVRPVILWWSRNDQKRGLLYHDSIGHSEVKSENILNIEINFLSKIVKFPVVPTNLEAFITGKTELASEASYPPSNWCHLTGCSFEVWYFEVHLGGSSLESASQQLPPGRCSALGQGFGRRLPNECLAQTTKEHFEQRIL